MGFKGSTANARIAQYEAGTCFPKEDGILKLSPTKESNDVSTPIPMVFNNKRS